MTLITAGKAHEADVRTALVFLVYMSPMFDVLWRLECHPGRLPLETRIFAGRCAQL